MKLLIITLSFLLTLSFPLTAQEAKRQISNITGDVYHFNNNNHRSLLVVTSEGVVRVDPINAEAGDWLNANLAAITDKPVTHLIYSHSHLDHASGGSAHAGAEFIAHENAPVMLDGISPTLRIGDNHTLVIGNKTIEITNLGPGHDSHMVAVVVRPENVAFIVDVAAPKRLPFRNFGRSDVGGWIDQIKKAQELDFEIFAPGHGNVGTPADLDDAMTYMQDLMTGVLKGLKAEKTVSEITEELTLDDYKNWLQYEAWRPLNIQGMAKYLQSTG
jgi:glyoxylase-like metal-dependent hydrolase (beta-lactamase superfamily II)